MERKNLYDQIFLPLTVWRSDDRSAVRSVRWMYKNNERKNSGGTGAWGHV